MRKLAQAHRMSGEGTDVADVCQKIGVFEQTYYRWLNQFGGMKADDAKRLKGPPTDNDSHAHGRSAAVAGKLPAATFQPASPSVVRP